MACCAKCGRSGVLLKTKKMGTYLVKLCSKCIKR